MAGEAPVAGVVEAARGPGRLYPTMPPLRVVVHGATGRMGSETLLALISDPDFVPVGAVGRTDRGNEFPLPDGSGTIPYATSLDYLLARRQADVVVDFTNAQAAVAAAGAAGDRGAHLVTGSSGFSEGDISKLRDASQRYQIGIILAPNFALGAVLLGYLARIAARYFDYADVSEAHHEAKIDAPSGTAIALAKAISGEKKFTRPEPEKEPLAGTRGGDYNGVSIHSTRMPGRLAHHEVFFGAPGQTLSLRHDTLSRECYMPAVMLAIKDVVNRRELVMGLESVLGLGQPG